MLLIQELRIKATTFGVALGSVLLGRWSPTLQVLLVLMICDYLSGVLLAWREGALSSRIGFRGVSRKILMLGLIALGHQLDQVLGGELLRDACALFYVCNESLSILENAAGLGVPLPTALQKALRVMQENIDK